DGQPEAGIAGAARLVVTIARLRKSGALVASPCTMSLGPEVVVRNLPSSEIERIAGRLPNPVSTSPRPKTAAWPFWFVTWIHQRRASFLLHATMFGVARPITSISDGPFSTCETPSIVTIIVCWGGGARPGHLSARGVARSPLMVRDCGGTMPVGAGAFVSG